MPTKTTRRRTLAAREEPAFVIREDPTDEGEPYRVKRPEVLVLEERHDALLAPTRLLTAAGYRIHTIFEESRIVAKIQAAASKHFLLLTVHETVRPLRVPQVIQDLRRDGYKRPVTYCTRGKTSPETRVAYEALSVNLVLSLPAATRSSVLDALAWVYERIASRESGITILEV